MKYTSTRPGRGYLANLLQACLLLVVAPALVFADSVPDTVQEHKLVRVVLNPDQKCFVLSAGLEPVDTVKTDEGVVFTGAPGRYVVLMIGDSDTSQEFVEITSKAPQPVPPGPGPVPPDPQPPTPDLDKAPLPGLAGLKVLLIYETADLPPKVPAEQYNIKVDPKVTSWLTAKTTPEDGWAGWRWGDPDSGVAQGAMHWEKMLSLPRTSTPWVVINNGTRNVGYSGPLPATSGEFLKLVEKYQ